jgi:ribonuclease BN (tRNA processing enzyme)
VRFTVVGKSPAWEDAGGACSCYLVEQDDYRLLIDCGNGALAKLRETVDYSTLDDVLISHIHGDHILDLVPLGYALTLGAGADGRRVPLHLPPGGAEQLRSLVAVWGSDGLIDQAYEPREYGVGDRLTLGPLAVALHEVPHFTLTHAVELTAPGGARIVYGSDCRAGPELERAAAGAAVLVAEATLLEPDEGPESQRGHMSPGEAGALAARAGVGRLVLTHHSDERDAERSLADASARFAGPIEIAATGSTWEL